MGGINPYSIALDEFSAPSDIATLNVSTSAHGLCPKLDNNSAHFLNGTGGWTTPAALPAGASGQVQFNSSGSFAGFAGLTFSASTPNVTMTAQGAAHVALLTVGAASQSANLQENRTSANVLMSGVGPNFAPFSNLNQSGSECFGLGTSCSTNAAVLGNGASTTGNNSVAIGKSAVAGTGGIAIGGGGPTSNGTFSISIGFSSTCNHASIVLGHTASSTANGQCILGGSNNPISNVYIGGGVTMASPAGITVQPSSASGTNVAGANHNVASGCGTGTGASGTVNIQTSPSGSTGTTLNSLVTVGQFDASTTAGNTRFLLWDVDKGALSRVSVGAADSGGTGYKLLRVPN